MESFGAWWDGLSLILKIYWCIAIPFTIFFLGQLIMSFMGGGDAPDDLPDSEVTGDHGISFQFLTLKNLVGFFAIFAWTGIACLDGGLSVGLSLLISVMAGLLMMALMAGLFYMMGRMNADGTMKIQKAVGQVGSVYIPIQANRKGMGQVQVTVMGSLRTLDAVTDDENDLPTGKVITVSQVINGNILLVTEK
jgi:membrane protein implicated in regulation of membrane protease activity